MKPPFSGVYVGRRGRIWTLLYTPTHQEPNPDHDPADPMSRPTIPVGEQILDVFEEDGTYLGEVEAPSGFNPWKARFDGDDVWAVTTDALGVQRVVRYALRPP